jgi:hypothetical protein
LHIGFKKQATAKRAAMLAGSKVVGSWFIIFCSTSAEEMAKKNYM